MSDGGHQPVLLSPESGTVQMFEHLDKADTQQVDLPVSQAKVADYDALVLPGGVGNPDALRTDETTVAFVRETSPPASPWRPSATRPGRWSRPASCTAGV